MPAVDYVEHRLYTRRWLVLASFILLSASSGFHYIQYAAISAAMCRFWSVGQNWINVFPVIYEATYIPGILPANWLLGKVGLYWAAALAALLTLLASVLKLLGSVPSGYWCAVAGQILAGIGELWILGIPPLLAGKWFGADEVGTATSLGVLGNLLGFALGCVVPPLIVTAEPIGNGTLPTDNNATGAFLDAAQRQLTWLSAGLTAVLLAAMLLVLLVIRSAPPTPPSSAQENDYRCSDNGGGGTLAEIRSMFTRGRGFFILFITYGINTGLLYAILTIMEPIIGHYYPHAGASVGAIGMTMVGCGMAGSVVVGPILDRTHRYKLITVIFYAASALLTAALIGGLYSNRIWTLFLIAGALGFFNTGYLPLGFEFGVELTYPASEANVGGMLNCSAQAFGIAFTYLGQYLIDIGCPICAIMLFAASFGTGLLLTAFIPEVLRRQAMERRASITYSMSE